MNDPHISLGTTYQEALKLLIQRCGEYKGDPISSSEDEHEDPLHYAVRLVESFQEADDARGPSTSIMRFHLPRDAWQHWGNLLRNCRSKRIYQWESQYDKNGPAFQYTSTNPRVAKHAATQLKAWARGELKRENMRLKLLKTRHKKSL